MSSPEFSCLDCRLPVKDSHQAVDCDSCGGWQHIRCNTGISRYIYRKMVQGLENRPFTCDMCKQNQIPEGIPVQLMFPRVDTRSESLAADLTSEYTDMDVADAVNEEAVSFNISTDFTRPDQSVIDDPAPIATTVEDRPTTYELIEGGSTKGGDLLVSSTEFAFSRKRNRGNVSYWWCRHRRQNSRCPATVVQKGDNFKEGLHSHIHPPEAGVKHGAKVAKKVKTEAKTNLFVSRKSLVEAAFDEMIRPEDFNLPDQNLLSRRANRARQNMRPPEPRGEDFELIQCAIPEGYLRKDLKVDGARHLIFATDRWKY